jgi:hypothetical protein
MAAPPYFAKLIQLKHESGGKNSLLIDGTEFPWYIGTRIDVVVDRGDMPSIAIQILADRVEVVDDIHGRVFPNEPSSPMAKTPYPRRLKAQ